MCPTLNHEKNLSKHRKIMFQVKMSQKYILTEFLDSPQNHEKIIGTPNQSIKKKISEKIVFYVY
jgi:hypothetical protein